MMPERTENLSNEDQNDAEEREAEVNRTLFLKGFPEKTTEDELYELFLQVNNFNRSRIFIPILRIYWK